MKYLSHLYPLEECGQHAVSFSENQPFCFFPSLFGETAHKIL
ncbi:hypothetical protein X975_10449, partial [Stegodyphus mimosarum]